MPNFLEIHLTFKTVSDPLLVTPYLLCKAW